MLERTQKDISEASFKQTLNTRSIADMWDMAEFSNGENNLDFLFGMRGITNSLIVLDEPETSLSIKSQCLIGNLIKELAVTNQVILITHSERLMRLTPEVYDFEKKKYVQTEKYINTQTANL